MRNKRVPGRHRMTRFNAPRTPSASLHSHDNDTWRLSRSGARVEIVVGPLAAPSCSPRAAAACAPPRPLGAPQSPRPARTPPLETSPVKTGMPQPPMNTSGSREGARAQSRSPHPLPVETNPSKKRAGQRDRARTSRTPRNAARVSYGAALEGRVQGAHVGGCTLLRLLGLSFNCILDITARCS